MAQEKREHKINDGTVSLNQDISVTAILRYLLDEHLLDDPRVSPATESTFRGLQQLLGRDEFELFPPSVRPQKSCLIVGGMGARSFLHG